MKKRQAKKIYNTLIKCGWGELMDSTGIKGRYWLTCKKAFNKYSSPEDHNPRGLRRGL